MSRLSVTHYRDGLIGVRAGRQIVCYLRRDDREGLLERLKWELIATPGVRLTDEMLDALLRQIEDES